jgi:hypothetical protein
MLDHDDIASVMNRWGSQGRIDPFVHINGVSFSTMEECGLT